MRRGKRKMMEKKGKRFSVIDLMKKVESIPKRYKKPIEIWVEEGSISRPYALAGDPKKIAQFNERLRRVGVVLSLISDRAGVDVRRLVKEVFTSEDVKNVQRWARQYINDGDDEALERIKNLIKKRLEG